MRGRHRSDDEDGPVHPVDDPRRGRAERAGDEPVLVCADDDDVRIVLASGLADAVGRVADLDGEPVSQLVGDEGREATQGRLGRAHEVVGVKRGRSDEHAGRGHLRRQRDRVEETNLGADRAGKLDGLGHDDRRAAGRVDGDEDPFHDPRQPTHAACHGPEDVGAAPQRPAAGGTELAARSRVFQVEVSARALSPFVELVGAARVEAIAREAEATRAMLGSHTVWNVNSTAAGGGVAEVLRSLLRYARGLGAEVRWLVIEGPPEFFAITKRLHNALHDNAGDGSPLGPEQAALYERVLAENCAQIERLIRPGDAVICHDPQTAGLIPHLRQLGERVVWRCHIGHEGPGVEADVGWRFLRKYLEGVPVAVFSRPAYVPSWFPRAHAVTLPPNIDPFSVKNEWMSELSVRAVLTTAGLVESAPGVCCPVYVGEDGAPHQVVSRANVIRMGGPPIWSVPLVVQVSRWDRMKDHIGLLAGFTKLLEQGDDLGAELILAGPAQGGVADDPEGPEVLREVEHAWQALSEQVRRRVHLAELPMVDRDENAAMVNALQRHATVVVQKSLREGFGLTVTEAMWKKRAVVASAVGGIQDQIDDGIEGLLVRDPSDASETARALRRVLESPELRVRMGDAAYKRVCSEYLSVSSLERWGWLIQLLYS